MKLWYGFLASCLSLWFCSNNGAFIGGNGYKSFLPSTYKIKGEEKESFLVRQVPGDGGCLFHAISAWISYIYTNDHLNFDWRMRNLSSKLRTTSVEILKMNRTLIGENAEELDSCSLIELVADHYNLTVTEYFDNMLNPTVWGGAPEIIALSNFFECPIHVYKLVASRKFTRRFFELELCSKFGSPNFDSNLPICILFADGRFPNITPGKQAELGNHFLALFPCDKENCIIRGTNYLNLDEFPEFARDLKILECNLKQKSSSTLGERVKKIPSIVHWLKGGKKQNQSKNIDKDQ